MSQIVIVAESDMRQRNDMSWDFKCFELAPLLRGRRSTLERKGIDYPDSLSIDIISLADSSVLETMVLHKMKAVGK